MEVLFFDKTWVEIPDQDNPAFDKITDVKEGIIRRNECVIVCKSLPYERKATTGIGFTVVSVPKKGDISRRGLFWTKEDAMKFGEVLAAN